MKLIFATNNKNKVLEIRSALPATLEIITLAEAGITVDIPEPFDSLEANATEKSSVIHRLTGENCFSEDSGLEADALNGAPGVRSARYAGEASNNDENISLLLQNMHGEENRQARFRTVISLILHGKEFQFSGTCSGKIISEKRGSGGFGYDAVFIPDGADLSFAEMTLDQKNTFSHRKKALAKLVDFLNNYDGKDQTDNS